MEKGDPKKAQRGDRPIRSGITLHLSMFPCIGHGTINERGSRDLQAPNDT